MALDSFTSLQLTQISSSLQLSNISLYSYTTTSLSIYLSMTSKLFPRADYYQYCCNEHWCMCLLKVWCSQRICPVVGLLGHVVDLFLVVFFLKDSSYCFPQWLYQLLASSFQWCKKVPFSLQSANIDLCSVQALRKQHWIRRSLLSRACVSQPSSRQPALVLLEEGCLQAFTTNYEVSESRSVVSDSL